MAERTTLVVPLAAPPDVQTPESPRDAAGHARNGAYAGLPLKTSTALALAMEGAPAEEKVTWGLSRVEVRVKYPHEFT